MIGYALKLQSGKFAKSQKTGTPVWYEDRHRAEEVNRLYWGESAVVTEVRLERDCAHYCGYFVRE